MAEEMTPNESQSLILSTDLEKFMLKIRETNLANLMVKQQRKFYLFVVNFMALSYSFFGLSEGQLKELSEAELKVLDELISRKARPWAISQMLFTFGIPIIGWICGMMHFSDGEFKSWSYLRYKKYARKRLSKDYSLPKALKEELSK